jgi:Arc/MetJ family transcription regulator
VKTTIEIPDALFRQTKAAAAIRGESLKEFVTAALRAHVEIQSTEPPEERGWRSVFGRARPEEVEEIERIVAEELERIDPEAWR